MKRKNCRISTVSTPAQCTSGTCVDNPAGRLRGVDPNRNYGGIWGGARRQHHLVRRHLSRRRRRSPSRRSQNIRELQSTRAITNLITNHTFSDLVLRAPGVADYGVRRSDEPQLRGARRRHGRATTATPTSRATGSTTRRGTTEDWTFWTAGSLELHVRDRHDRASTRRTTTASWTSTSVAGRRAGAGKGGNREAYYEMLVSHASTQSLHSVHGRHGAERLGAEDHARPFQTETSPVWINDYGDRTSGRCRRSQDTLDVHDEDGTARRSSGTSTRRRGRGGRARRARPRPGRRRRTSRSPTRPASPPRTSGDQLAGAHEAFSFDVEGPPAVDNGRMTVHIDWGNADTDWDVYVLRPGRVSVVTQSASFGDTDRGRDPRSTRRAGTLHGA